MEKRTCKYKKCHYYDPKAKTYCCDACSADAYDDDRLHKEEIVKENNVGKREIHDCQSLYDQYDKTLKEIDARLLAYKYEEQHASVAELLKARIRVLEKMQYLNDHWK